jgi:hypothetical protein
MADYVKRNWTSQSSSYLGAFVLWQINWIHPFEDGNGRVARALCSAILSVKNCWPTDSIEKFVQALTKGCRSAEFASLMNATNAHALAGNLDGATRPLQQWLDSLASTVVAQREPSTLPPV